uniref:Stromal cell-derived factor 1 n=1 Tax=Sus scrofa TaxID=9823 RepID=A0A8D1JE29_PIG
MFQHCHCCGAGLIPGLRTSTSIGSANNKTKKKPLYLETPEQGGALILTSLPSQEKPVSLSYRCPCRFFESHVARANIKHLKILNTPNCALQIVARLKSNNRQVCIDPKLKWIQEYLEKALNKPSPTLSGLTSALGSSLASTTVGITSRS